MTLIQHKLHVKNVIAATFPERQKNNCHRSELLQTIISQRMIQLLPRKNIKIEAVA